LCLKNKRNKQEKNSTTAHTPQKRIARAMEEGISIPFDAFNCSSCEWSECRILELQHRASYF